MITINSNASALMAQNNLFKSQSALSGNMQQLSTGLRINSASDDAAGLQISNRMETQMNGLSVAQRNANDGISMAQTAEGAMTENTTILNRMRDLSLQSANDTNTLDDRQAMQKEVAALVDEVDRIADTTNFAGINLLDGTAKNMSFQIGSNAGETIEFSIDDVSASALGVDLVTATGVEVFRTDGNPAGDFAVVMRDADGDVDGEKYIYAEDHDDLAGKVSDHLSSQGLDGAIVTFEDVKGTPGAKTMNIVLDDTKVDVNGVETSSEDALSAITTTTTVTPSVVTNFESLDKVDLESAAGAQTAVKILDGALAQIDDQRANLGAVQNRLESTISNLSNIEENLGVAQSRILDADFASQTVEMTSNQMLMQAGTSVLAQAKGMPQYATMLL